ncbi:MAG: hypothetical protein HUJ51_02645 [Eggerthellaceae bacterium]|nr:hypothetical protein [Eggerthellaceae bacterium]
MRSGESITFSKNVKPSSFKVAFDSTGSKGSMENQSFIIDDCAAHANSAFTRDRFEFLACNTMPDYSGTRVSPGILNVNIYTSSEAEPSDSILLYPIWNEIIYTVNYYDAIKFIEPISA